MKSYLIVSSPVGDLTLTDSDGVLTGLSFGTVIPRDAVKQVTPLLSDTKTQLDEYFNGTRKTFRLPLPKDASSEFSTKIRQFLLSVPYGKTATYSDAAAFAGNPKAVRAAGRAIGDNPVAIIIPCHRIIGKNGNLTGFNGGLDIKQSLLALEKMYL